MHQALEAAERLAAENIDVEVIDLRSIRLMDRETILHQREENPQAADNPRGQSFGGVGAEISAMVMEDPLLRVGRPGRAGGAAPTCPPWDMRKLSKRNS